MNMEGLSDEQKLVFAEHVHISSREMDHLLSSPAVANQVSDLSDSKCFAIHGSFRAESRAEAASPRSTPRGSGMLRGTVQCHGQIQDQEQGIQDSVRRDSNQWTGYEGPSNDVGNMAVLQQACCPSGQQPLWPLERVQSVRSETVLHSGQGCPRTNGTCGSSSERDGSILSPPDRGVRGPGAECSNGESYDHDRGQREDPGEEGRKCQGQDEGQSKGSASALRGRDACHRGLGQGRRVHFHHGDGRGESEAGQGDGQELRTGSNGQPEVGAMDSNHVHNEPTGTSQDECVRTLRQVESQQLHHAAKEFVMESAITSMQDFDPLCTVWEVCCRPDSSLTQECARQGLHARRKSIENGYDLEKASTVKQLKEDMRAERPGRGWFSLKCTEWTNIQNINQRTPQQIEVLKRRRWKSRKMMRNALEVIEEGINTIEGYKFYWEWPKSAYAGWNQDEMKKFIQRMQRRGIRLYWTEMHGCMFDMRSPSQELINKAWYILTNDAHFHHKCWTTCDRSHEHRPGGVIGMGTLAVEATGYYPQKMVKKIVNCWHSELQKKWRHNDSMMIIEELYTMDDGIQEEQKTEDDEQVSPEHRKRAESLLHRLHRAAGHPSNKALARLCRDRCMPKWVINMALRLQCQACTDVKRGEQGILPYSLGAKPVPWQVVAADVMEMVFPEHRIKARFLVMTDVVMKFTSAKLIWQGPISEGGAGTDAGKKLVEAFVDGWLLHRPRPMWVVVDPQTSLSAGVFVEFMQLIGVGVSVTPGEAPLASW